MPQYFKLRKKVEAGAQVRDQPDRLGHAQGRRAAALDRRATVSRSRCSPTSISSRAQRRARSTPGKIPGVVVTDELLALVEREAASPDKGRAFFVELAAKQVAVSRGLGFAGVYLGGHMPPSTFGEILDRAALVRARRLAAVRARDPVSVRRRVLLLRARPRDTALVGARSTPRTWRRSEHAHDRAARAARSTGSAGGCTQRRSSPTRRSFRPGARSTGRSRSPRPLEGRARRRAGGEGAALPAAATAATARCRTSPTSARSRSARRTSATARAAARARGCARSTTPSASGRRPTSG